MPTNSKDLPQRFRKAVDERWGEVDLYRKLALLFELSARVDNTILINKQIKRFLFGGSGKL